MNTLGFTLKSILFEKRQTGSNLIYPDLPNEMIALYSLYGSDEEDLLIALMSVRHRVRPEHKAAIQKAIDDLYASKR